jgi:hypothetical protein
MRFRGIPTKQFIDQRDAKVAVDANPNPTFRWDSEFPEMHQAEIDENQEIYEGYEYDTFHKLMGRLDYKQYSKAGVHVSDYIARQVKAGMIDHFVVWMWSKPYEELKANHPVEYDILGYVDAKSAIKNRDPKTKRFTFEEERGIIQS